jgi:biotin-dependent carboxylase-like uncharacterized protein
MLEVLEPGGLTTVQDPVGRHAWRHLGVPAGGAADPWCARLANRLVGNPDDAALLENTLVGPVIRFDTATAVALTGMFAAAIDGLELPPNIGRAVRAGSVLRIGEGTDARGYLAVAGGLNVEMVLGSRSTDLRSRFGGLDGRAVRAGDRLRTGSGPVGPLRRWSGGVPDGAVRVVVGPHGDPVQMAAITSATWRVGALADRTGVRLEGTPLPGGTDDEVPSFGLAVGAMQVPPNGLPIVTLADRPVTGGYRVPAVVIGADIGRVARLRTGDEVRFASVSFDDARLALRKAEDELADLETLDAPEIDEPGWAGSHR